jgi:hypothetical protein
MKTAMAKRFLVALFIIFICSKSTFAALTFDWNGSGTSWTSPGSWNETGGSGNYPGQSGTTDIVRFGVTGSSYTNQPILTTSLTIASIEFGGKIESGGTALTVNGATLTVGTIIQDVNTLSTCYDYLQGTGTINCTTITLGSGTSTSGKFNFMLSDIATLNVSGNVVIITNVNGQNGSGFRLENGSMYLSGVITFNALSGITASNAAYFTVNTVAQAGGNTTPHLYLSNANAIGTIPTPKASVNFYGDRGGTGYVTYTAANPTIYTTSTPGFGSGGATIDTTKSTYDYLTIQGSGTATIGGSTVGALKVTGDFTTSSPATFNTTGTTNTSVGGNWINSSTITGGTGTTAVSGNITNSGSGNMAFAGGNVYVGGNLVNDATMTAGNGNITVAGSFSNSVSTTLEAGNLTIGGNYTNSAAFTAGTGTVYFNGASVQSLVDNSTTGTTFNNVDFKGGGTKTLSGTGSFSIAGIGVLTMEANTVLNTGNILTLKSTSTSSATVAAIPSTSNISGTVNVQRYISGGSNAYRGYRLLSSPVYTAKSGSNYYYDLSYLSSYAPITGSTGTSGGFTQTGNPSMALFRDNIASVVSFYGGNYRGITQINNSPLYAISIGYDGIFNLHVGTGFVFFYRGDLTNLSTKFNTTTVAEPNVFVSTGTLNQQAVTVINWYTGLNTLQYSTVAGNAIDKGDNLVGNPYASSIDWNTYSTTNPSAGIYAPHVGSTIWVYNTINKAYAAYNSGIGTNGATNIIASGQGFFVRTDTTGAQLIFNESAKTNAQLSGPTQATGSTLLLSNAPVASTVLQYLRLELEKDSINKEETVIRFSGSAKNSFVVNEDSEYMPGFENVNLYSTSTDNVALAINNMPLPKQSQTIKLNVNAIADGTCKLNMTEINAVPNLYDIWLMDAYKKDSLNMRHNSAYIFQIAKSDTNSYGSNRFSLVIRQNPQLAVHLLDFTATKAKDGAQLIWKTINEENYTYFTIERSTDNGATFNVLGGFVSNAMGTYNFLDKHPLKGTAANMYRLKIEDLNGTISYSNVVKVTYSNSDKGFEDNNDNNISVYPNPATNNITVTILQNNNIKLNNINLIYNIKIMNSYGLIIKTAISSQISWKNDISNLLPGTYFIQVVNNNDNNIIGNSKFVKL